METFVKIEDVISRKIGDEIVVIKNDGLSVHLLNKTAAFIWEKCAETSEPDKIASMLCDRYEISFEEARQDVLGILQKMEESGLLKKMVAFK